MEQLKKKLTPVLDFASGISSRNLFIYATSGCYYMFMSLVPIAMIVCCILPYTPFSLSMVLGLIDSYFSSDLGDIMRKIVTAIYSSNAATLTVSLVLTLYSASASMKAIINGMDAAYSFKNKNGFIKATLKALGCMVLFVVVLLLSLGLMVYGGKILQILQSYLPMELIPAFLTTILSNARFVIVMVILALFFALFYAIMPSEKVRFRDQIPGAIFSAVVWVIFSSVFSWYIDISDKYGAYGVIGTIMVAMMWINYCLLFLLIGGYINSYLTEMRRK